MGYLLIILFAILACLAIDFGFVALVVKIVCWAFGLAFSWKIALAVWLVTIVFAGIVRSGRNN